MTTMTNIARLVTIIVISLVIAGSAIAQESTSVPASGTAPASVASAPEAKVDINTATAEEFATLFRVGDKIAATIVKDRDENGPFKSIDDLTRVFRVGPKTIENNKDRLTISGIPSE